MTKTVKKNAEEITDFLQGIGNVNFAGAMDRQAKTLQGAFSNLQDAITQALTVEGTELDGLTMEIRDLTDLLKDPETVKAIQTLTSALVTGFSSALSLITATTSHSFTECGLKPMNTTQEGNQEGPLLHGSAD